MACSRRSEQTATTLAPVVQISKITLKQVSPKKKISYRSTNNGPQETTSDTTRNVNNLAIIGEIEKRKNVVLGENYEIIISQ